MDAPTKSWLSAKFSRFHSSQQCDERKAVYNAIVANFAAVWRKNLRMSHFQPRASFRENRHTSQSADFVPMQYMPFQRQYVAQNFTTGENQNRLRLLHKSKENACTGKCIVYGIVVVDAIYANGLN